MSAVSVLSAAASAAASASGSAAAKPFIDWAALGKVAGVSLVFALGVVVIFSLGVVGLSMARGSATVEDEPTAPGATPLPANRALGAVLAAVCFVASAGAVVYGLYLIIPQFHN